MSSIADGITYALVRLLRRVKVLKCGEEMKNYLELKLRNKDVVTERVHRTILKELFGIIWTGKSILMIRKLVLSRSTRLHRFSKIKF